MNSYNLSSNLKKIFFSIIFLVIAVIIGNRALLSDVVYESDDYLHHAARTANYYLALRQGQLPVRWAPNLNNSYGYPSFNYMYHTPYVVGSFFHFLNFSVQQSMNLSVLSSILIGAIGCFIFVKSYKISNLWSIILSMIFVFNPYTLLSIYWRGAVGELYFYGFIPLLLLFIRKLILSKTNDKNWKLYIFGVSIITSLIILSHLPSVIILAPVVAIFVLTEFGKKIDLKKVFTIITSGFIGLLFSSWYWMPAYFEQWMISYQSGSSLAQHLDQFTPLLSIFDIRKDFYSSDIFLNVIQIGGPSLIAIIVGLYLTRKNKKVLYWLGLVATSIFFLTSYSKIIWDSSKIIQYLQYPWRMLWVVTLASIMILIIFVKSKNVSKTIKKVSAILISLGIIFSAQDYTYTKGSTSRTDFDWYQTFATGSSFDEHKPIWSKTPYYFPEELLFINSAELKSLNKDNLDHRIHTLSELNPSIINFDGTSIEYVIFPTEDIITIHKRLFYPGWEAHLDENKIEFVEDLTEYNGILALEIPAKESHVKITFTGFTELRKITELLSVFSFMGVIIFLLFYKRKK